MTNQETDATYFPTLEELEGKKKSLSKKSARKFSASVDVRSIFNGNFLASQHSVKQLPFLLFLACIGMLYIANTYYAERKIRKISKLSKEIKQLHSDYILSKSALMTASKQSYISAKSAAQGLRESTRAPYKIVSTSISNQVQ
jgi:hypothetical protein